MFIHLFYSELKLCMQQSGRLVSHQIPRLTVILQDDKMQTISSQVSDEIMRMISQVCSGFSDSNRMPSVGVTNKLKLSNIHHTSLPDTSREPGSHISSTGTPGIKVSNPEERN